MLSVELGQFLIQGCEKIENNWYVIAVYSCMRKDRNADSFKLPEAVRMDY